MPHTSLVHYETDNPELIQGFRVSSVIVDCETRFQRVRIYNTPAFGKVLVLDNETQSAERDEKVYHETLVHPVMSTCYNAPRRVLIIGGGEGATAREVLRYSSVEQVTMIDIDSELMKLCRTHLHEWGANAWSDKRLTVFEEDAYDWLEKHDEQFDVIIMDLCDPDFECVENQINRFYSTEFAIRLRDKHLTENGVLVMQCGDYESMSISTLPFFDAFQRKCCHTYTTFIPSFTSMWGFLIAHKGLRANVVRLPNELKHMTQKRLNSLLVYDFMEAPGYDMIK